jgi:type IV pilus assembly protein PilW
MTLIELMVAMLIGLGVTLAITSLLIAGENHKRTTTSTNDAEQTGAYVFYALDRVLRGAGSAIAESAYSTDRGVLGCRLNAAAILPRAAAFPLPFNNVAFTTAMSSNLRVAPLLIAKNQSAAGTDDVLVVMGGSGAAGGVSRQVTAAGSSTTVTMDNTVGFAVGDLALVSQPGQPGIPDCLLEQVTGGLGTPTLTMGTGVWYYTAGTTTTLATLAGSTNSYVTPLGNANANNLQFLMFGVGANRTLYSYDLLQNLKIVQGSGGDVAQAIADGVDQLHAIYGIDTNGDGVQDTWIDPGATGYDIASVMTSAATMKKIVSVRVALVVRGEYYDKNPASPPTLTLFGGLTDAANNPLPLLKQTINLSAATDQHYRYRVFEFTVPLRNMILLAGGP